MALKGSFVDLKGLLLLKDMLGAFALKDIDVSLFVWWFDVFVFFSVEVLFSNMPWAE